MISINQYVISLNRQPPLAIWRYKLKTHLFDNVTALAHLWHHFLVALRLANLRYINLINNDNNGHIPCTMAHIIKSFIDIIK